jgi:tripartite-type tricarboxylate transporter receptor subunit TctC
MQSKEISRGARGWARILGGLAIALATTGMAQAAYPDRPIRLVVGFAAGGPTDAAARIVAKGLTDQLGVQVVVDNRTGANANIAAENVLQSPADGYTLLYATSSIVISQFLYKDLRYALKDFTPVALTVTIPHVIVVPESSPYKKIEDLIAALKAGQPLSYASAGVGNANHLSPLLFLNVINAKALHVPYRGSAPALNDLVAGRIDFMADAVSTELPFIQANKLRALGVAGKEPIEQLPGVPPLADAIVPGYEVGAWSGVLASNKTPKDVVEKLNAAISKALATAAIRELFKAQGVTVLGSTPEDFGRFLDTETGRLGKVIKDANIQPE